jgi:hypothetical protein
MADFVFTGEYQELSSVQLQFVNDTLSERGFNNNNVVFEPVGELGDNYASNVKRIQVKVDNGDDFYMIAKIAPTEENLRNMMMISVTFNNEILMYTQVFPKFESLLEAADVPLEDRLRYPVCYGCITEAPNEIILLEDLKTLDYVMLDRLKSLSNHAMKLILKNFAILHSLSFALKKSSPDTYTTFKDKLIDMWTVNDTMLEYEKFMSQVVTEVVAILEKEEHKSVVRGSLEASMATYRKLRKHAARSKYSIIQQGDAWTNNIMFRLKVNIRNKY